MDCYFHHYLLIHQWLAYAGNGVPVDFFAWGKQQMPHFGFSLKEFVSGLDCASLGSPSRPSRPSPYHHHLFTPLLLHRYA